jgi:hypothetical protein
MSSCCGACGGQDTKPEKKEEVTASADQSDSKKKTSEKE